MTYIFLYFVVAMLLCLVAGWYLTACILGAAAAWILIDSMEARP